MNNHHHHHPLPCVFVLGGRVISKALRRYLICGSRGQWGFRQILLYSVMHFRRVQASLFAVSPKHACMQSTLVLMEEIQCYTTWFERNMLYFNIYSSAGFPPDSVIFQKNFKTSNMQSWNLKWQYCTNRKSFVYEPLKWGLPREIPPPGWHAQGLQHSSPRCLCIWNHLFSEPWPVNAGPDG